MSDTKPIVFQRGDKGCLQVVTIVENVKSFNTSQGIRYRHDITFINDDKKMVKGEYLTPEEYQTVFKVGKKACFECLNHGVIVPMGSPEEWEELGENILVPQTKGGELFVIALQEAVKIACAQISLGQAVEPHHIFANADLFFEYLESKHKRTLNIMK